MVIVSGAAAAAAIVPHAYPRPLLFAALLAASSLMSLWKVNLPICLNSGATLSMSYAANLMSLLLLGPSYALVIAVAGTWTQCTYKVKRRYPFYRKAFSMSAEALTMLVTGLVYGLLDGRPAPLDTYDVARPIVGAIATYFVVNTGLVATAIALSSGRPVLRVWQEDFLWSGASFVVAGTAGAIGAIVVERGAFWTAVLMLAPVHLTYRTYKVFVGRLDDERRHLRQTRRVHRRAVEALSQAREAKRALEDEKQRLAAALTHMAALEESRRQLLEREQAARAAAEEASRLKDQFLASVSHELRTPLNAVLGWTDILRRGRISESKREAAIEAIYRSGKRQAALIDDLLDVAGIMSGKLRLEFAAVDIATIVRDALEVVQPAAASKGIHISVDAATGLPPIEADAARLQQVASNLLSNAVKFTPADGRVHVRLRQDGEQVELVVADTGQGIPADFLASAFDPFRQADASTTRVHSGLGLGLSIVKQLVNAHRGTVTAQSDGVGRGASFTVRLPAITLSQRDGAAAGPRTASGESAEPTNSLQGISVLVVDDDQESREVVAAHLAACDAVVLTAASAAEARSLLEQEHVDVMLADIAMPDEDGYEFVRKLRTCESPTARIPAAALTAFAREEDRRRAMEAGFQLHLAKPIEARSLTAAVANLRNSRAA
jgi:signal transduction histidine kinase/CheY-like chemotaxis protein